MEDVAHPQERIGRAIIDGRGGFLEREDGGPTRLDQAEGMLAEVAIAGARILLARPDAKLLRFTLHSATLTSESNLLHGESE